MEAFAQISINSVAFLCLCGLLIFAGWSRREGLLVCAIAITGIAMAASWLHPMDAVVFVGFLAPPYLFARAIWGRKDALRATELMAIVSVQVLLFLIVKRYAWFDILGWLGHPVSIIGVSYILFRQIHLLVDAPTLGHLPISLTRYLAFMLSPWTLAAGPIQRYEGFTQGAANAKYPGNDKALKALHRGIDGLLKAFVLGPLFQSSSSLANLHHADANWLDLGLVVYGFPIYIYLNFSGYTDLMIAAAAAAGFGTLPENFNRPYLAANSRDFWTRWHISFGLWMRHYVFTPLSTTFLKLTPSAYQTPTMIVVVIIVFLLVGGWHGTTSNYFVFGLTQAFGVLASAGFESWRRRRMGRQAARALADKLWFRAASIFITLNYTCACMILLNGSLNEVRSALSAFFHGS